MLPPWGTSLLLRCGVTPYHLRYHLRALTRALMHLFARGPFPVFRELAIETSAYCNRKCPACPVSFAPRPKDGVMDEALFTKLIRELAGMDYAGRVALHFFNEPLTDIHLIDRIRHVADRVPRATIEIHSNGDYLTKTKMEDLCAAGLSYIIVTAYSDTALARLRTLEGQLGARERAAFDLRPATNLTGNRAGALPQFAVPEPLIADCFQPAYKMVINYKGEAVICTNDYFAHSVMGNAAEQTLMEIWHGRLFQSARQTLRQRRREGLAACAGCNIVSTPLKQRHLTPEEVLVHNSRMRQTRGQQASERGA